MRIGIIAAMQLELTELKKLFNVEYSSSYAKNLFNTYYYKEHELILVCSGQGKTNSAVATQLLIDKFEIDFVINIGICGGISQSSKLLDVYVGEKYVHYDVRIKQSLYKFPNQLFYSSSKELTDCLLSLDYPIKKGIFGTGEGFVTKGEMREKLIEDLGIDCVDMESASIAQACYLNDTPFVSIRTVSDTANDEAISTTENYQKKAMKNVSLIVKSLLDRV